MYYVGDKIIYGENGVCTIEKIGPLDPGSVANTKQYYHLSPLVGSGMVFSPVDSGAFMRLVINAEEANALIDSIPNIAPAICEDNRFNHVDAFYRELFKQHSNEVLVSVIKGLKIRMASKKSKSSRAEATMKRAKDILFGELSVALGMEIKQVEGYIEERVGKIE